MTELCLPPAHADCVRRILLAHLPGGARVSVFGSRATGRRLKPHSDLDLLIDSQGELPLAAIAELREAFAESNLPFPVDLLERCDASAEFLSRIENEGMVELSPLPAEQPSTGIELPAGAHGGSASGFMPRTKAPTS